MKKIFTLIFLLSLFLKSDLLLAESDPVLTDELSAMSSPCDELPAVSSPCDDELIPESSPCVAELPAESSSCDEPPAGSNPCDDELIPESSPCADELPAVSGPCDEPPVVSSPCADELIPESSPCAAELPAESSSCDELPVVSSPCDELPVVSSPCDDELIPVSSPCAAELPPMSSPCVDELPPVICPYAEGLPPMSYPCEDSCERYVCPPVSLCYRPNQCMHFFVTADYLFWKAHVDGLAFAVDGLPTASAAPTPVVGSVKNLRWRWDSGFRVGIGTFLPCWDLDLYLNFTNFTTKATGSAFDAPIDGEAFLWATWGSPSGASFITNASGSWDLKYRSLDFEIGRAFCYKKCFSFRPFGGLKAVWTKDTYDITYFTSTVTPPFLQFIENRQHLDGVGPRIGLCNNWTIWNRFSLFADAAISVVWNHYKLHRVDTIDVVITQIDVKDNFSTLKPIFDFKIGIAYQRVFFECLPCYFKVAYENLLFVKHNQLLRGTSGSDLETTGNVVNNDKDLAFYGLTLRAGLAF